ECPKSPRKDQKAFVGGSWSDGGEDDEEPKKDEACLMAQETNEVHSDSSFYNSSTDDDTLQTEYNKLCELKKRKAIDEDCISRQELGLEIEKLNLTQETLIEQNSKFANFKKSTRCVNVRLKAQKSPNDITEFNVSRTTDPFERDLASMEPEDRTSLNVHNTSRTENKNHSSSYQAYDRGNVILRSNLKEKIIGKGAITHDSLTIENVDHVDNLGFNLLSISQICDKKFKVLFSETKSKILKDGITIGRGIRNNDLYVMKIGRSPRDKPCLTTIDDNSSLWHRRLGHANMRLIQSLSSKELVSLLPKCLELLHMDLLGPSAIQSYGVESQIIENEVDTIDLKENGPLNNEIVNDKESKKHPLDKS
ncbi:retrovirus-related pol polyprotein from transposon TNT 1-94, partial [Tanacetum coccineum]